MDFFFLIEVFLFWVDAISMEAQDAGKTLRDFRRLNQMPERNPAVIRGRRLPIYGVCDDDHDDSTIHPVLPFSPSRPNRDIPRL